MDESLDFLEAIVLPDAAVVNDVFCVVPPCLSGWFACSASLAPPFGVSASLVCPGACVFWLELLMIYGACVNVRIGLVRQVSFWLFSSPFFFFFFFFFRLPLTLFTWCVVRCYVWCFTLGVLVVAICFGGRDVDVVWRRLFMGLVLFVCLPVCEGFV
jgi:hypothetical protein